MRVSFPEGVLIHPVVRVKLYSLLERIEGLRRCAAIQVHIPKRR